MGGGGFQVGKKTGEDSIEVGKVAGGFDDDFRACFGRIGREGKQAPGSFCDGRAGIDQRGSGWETTFNDGPQKGIVGAAQNEDISAFVEKWLDGLVDSRFRLRSAKSSFFHEFDESRAGAGDDANSLSVRVDKTQELFPGDGSLGRENSDDSACSGRGGGFYSGFHPDDGQKTGLP